tara:strand:- start:1204 stop:1563 length:360 start_codon:yes stop_codon:yes gene_type:complete
MRISKNKIKNIVSRQYNKELKIHNRNKRITKLIKEEVARGFNEGANDEEFDMMDKIVAAIGVQDTLENLIQALPSQTVIDTLGYIAQQYDIPMELDEETKPHEADRTQGRDVPEDRIRK